jgi:hypothetical protein
MVEEEEGDDTHDSTSDGGQHQDATTNRPKKQRVRGVRLTRMPLVDEAEEMDFTQAFDAVKEDCDIDSESDHGSGSGSSSSSSSSSSSEESHPPLESLESLWLSDDDQYQEGYLNFVGGENPDQIDSERSSSRSNTESSTHTTPSEIEDGNDNDNDFTFTLRTDSVMLATGHSARDVYWHLAEAGVALEPKDFAVGLRLQIRQKYIDDLQFGENARHPLLGPAEFSLKTRIQSAECKGNGNSKDGNSTDNGRNVYTFCMCPGGVIVNASHGNNEVAINGMSYSTRASRYANAAFVVNVGGRDFDGYTPPSNDEKARLRHILKNKGPFGVSEGTGCSSEDLGEVDVAASVANGALRGLFFQQHWERASFDLGGGDYAAPAQRVTDFLHSRREAREVGEAAESQKERPDLSSSSSSSSSEPRDLPDALFMGRLKQANLNHALPDYVTFALAQALKKHGARKMPGGSRVCS